MSIRNLVSATTSSAANGIIAISDAGSLLTDWVKNEKTVRIATDELGVEKRITSAFLDHAKWKKNLTNEFSQEELNEAHAMMQAKGLVPCWTQDKVKEEVKG